MIAPMSRGTVFQVNVSRGGVPKHAIASDFIGPLGLASDAQADRHAHGGPLKAVCLYAVERLADLAAEGHRVFPGALGENITVQGLDWDHVVPGARIRLGDEVLLEVTEYTAPCWKNAQWFSNADFTRIEHRANPGWARVYARVLATGYVATGDEVELRAGTAAERVWRTQPQVFYRWSPEEKMPTRI
jgi:MOSC domain-containing protein YiiM